jgi:hypothetical protein
MAPGITMIAMRAIIFSVVDKFDFMGKVGFVIIRLRSWIVTEK